MNLSPLIQWSLGDALGRTLELGIGAFIGAGVGFVLGFPVPHEVRLAGTTSTRWENLLGIVTFNDDWAQIVLLASMLVGALAGAIVALALAELWSYLTQGNGGDSGSNQR